MPANTDLAVTETGPATESTTNSCEFGGISGTGTSIGPFQMSPGDDLDCEFTNTLAVVTPDIDLTIEKVVVVESGATGPSSGSFSITLDCGSDGSLTFTPGVGGGTSSALNVPSAAACTLIEGDSLGADQITGEFFSAQTFTSSQTLTVTNSYVAATVDLTIEKVVVVQSGATGPSSGTFSITLDCGNDGSLTFTPDVGGGTSSVLGVPSGASCTLIEGDSLGADQVSGEITPAQTFTSSQTLTVTNTYLAPATATLTVTKIVVNDDGGTAVVADFTLQIDGGAVSSGAANTVSVGAHTVSETGGLG